MRTDVVLLLMGYHESTEYSSQFNQKDVLYDYSYDLENVWEFKVFLLQLYFMAYTHLISHKTKKLDTKIRLVCAICHFDSPNITATRFELNPLRTNSSFLEIRSCRILHVLRTNLHIKQEIENVL